MAVSSGLSSRRSLSAVALILLKITLTATS